MNTQIQQPANPEGANELMAFKMVREYVSNISHDRIDYCTEVDNIRAGDIVLGAKYSGESPPAGIIVSGGVLSDKVSKSTTEEIEIWQKQLLSPPEIRIQTHSLSYDNALAFVLLLIRCRFKTSIESHFSPWLDIARATKKGDFSQVGKPGHSIYWLIDSLGHGHLDNNSNSISQPRVARGFLLIIELLLASLENNASPTNIVPSVKYAPSFNEAIAFHKFTRERYEKVVASGDSLQLLLPVVGGNKKMLVDVLLVSDNKPLGDIRAFAIDDEHNTWRKTGYSVIATHQQQLAENNPYSYSISVLDSNFGISLEPVVPILQAMENSKCVSKPAQWRTDYNGSLLRTNKGGSPSALSWREDVLQAIWETFNPGVGLKVCSWLGPETNELSACTGFSDIKLHHVNEKKFCAIRWSIESSRDELPTCPTFDRLLIAYLDADRTPGLALPKIDCLPPDSSIRHLKIPGGFVLIHWSGVVVIDDWTKDPVNFKSYFNEFENVSGYYEKVSSIGEKLKQLSEALDSMKHGNSVTDDKFDKWLNNYANLRLELGEVVASTLTQSKGYHTRLFRVALEESWGINEQLQDLTAAVEQIHSSLEIKFKIANDKVAFGRQRIVMAIGAFWLPWIPLLTILDLAHASIEVKLTICLFLSIVASVFVFLLNNSRYRQLDISNLAIPTN